MAEEQKIAAAAADGARSKRDSMADIEDMKAGLFDDMPDLDENIEEELGLYASGDDLPDHFEASVHAPKKSASRLAGLPDAWEGADTGAATVAAAPPTKRGWICGKCDGPQKWKQHHPECPMANNNLNPLADSEIKTTRAKGGCCFGGRTDGDDDNACTIQ